MVIKAEKLTKKYDEKTVLSDVSFTVRSGEKLILEGNSGKGKTTLLRIIMGLEKADQGVLSVSDEKGACTGRISYGVSFQDDRLCEEFDAFTNVRIVNRGLDTEKIISELTELLPVEDIYKPVSTLSGGMKRRVSIVRACASERDVYIFDEPFSGLDTGNAVKAAEYIRKKTGEGILFLTTHVRDYNEILGGFDVLDINDK